MSHISAHVADTKPVETVHPDNLPAASQDPGLAATALEKLVAHSEDHGDVKHGIHAPMHMLHNIPLVHKLVPGIEQLASQYHVGNFVIVRSTGERIFESMPIYPR